MTLQQQFDTTLTHLQKVGERTAISANALISLIDLTLLDELATAAQIETLAIRANVLGAASLCILPQHIAYLPQIMQVKCATVINFPTGNQSLQAVLTSIEQASTHSHLHEIDYVFPYQTYLAGNQQRALTDCMKANQACKRHGLTFKVILETGALPTLETIFKLSSELIQLDCDFLKTSTGKITIGATLPAAFAVLSAIKESDSLCGIKCSGGIKSVEQALSFFQLAQYMLNKTPHPDWFRFGASSLVDKL